MALVSVVIPTYNGGAQLSEAIQSCLTQTFQDFEIVLVNNQASKETIAIVNSYVSQFPNKIRIVSEIRQGACSARNRGILESKGKYVALLDEDDLMYPRRLEAQHSAAENHPEASMIHSLFDRVSPDNKEIVSRSDRGTSEFWRELLFEKKSPLANSPTVFPSVMFFSREKALKAGLFDENFNPQCGEESEFCLRMSEAGSFILVNETLVRYRNHHQKYCKEFNKKYLYTIIKNRDLFYRILSSKYNFSEAKNARASFRKIRGRWLRELGLLLFPYKSGKQLGRYMVNRSLKENPFDFNSWKVLIRTCYPHSLWPSALHFDEWIDDPLPQEVSMEFMREIFRSLPSVCLTGKRMGNLKGNIGN